MLIPAYPLRQRWAEIEIDQLFEDRYRTKIGNFCVAVLKISNRHRFCRRFSTLSKTPLEETRKRSRTPRTSQKAEGAEGEAKATQPCGARRLSAARPPRTSARERSPREDTNSKRKMTELSSSSRHHLSVFNLV